MSLNIHWLHLLCLILLWVCESNSQDATNGTHYLHGSSLESTYPRPLQEGNSNYELQLEIIEEQLLKIFVSDIKNDRLVCRSSNERKINDHNLPIGLFALDSCARCYGYIIDVPAFFDPYRKWNRTEVSIQVPSHLLNETMLHNITVAVLKNDHLNVIEVADHENPTALFRTSFRSENALERWISCCDAAVRCCETMGSALVANGRFIGDTPRIAGTTFIDNSSSSHWEKACPWVWDGWTCWHTTGADRLAVSKCPNYIYIDSEPPSCPRYAQRYCGRDGNWSPRKDAKGTSNKKTDYQPCGEVMELKNRAIVHIVAYAVSVVALIPALIIFYSYKQLNVYRIRLHKNLFFSILLNAIFVIIFKCVVIMPSFAPQRPLALSHIRQNTLICRTMLILTRYLRLSNYMWMFCEGFYLHRLIAAAFAEQKSFIIFYIIGWAFPFVPIGIYAAIRGIWYDDRCWIEPIEHWEWVLNAPCLFALLVNSVFLVNIIRILVNKLRTAHSSNEPSQYRKAVRATLVLVPLFGLHFALTIYRPPRGGCEWIKSYQYLNILLDGLQGTIVAIIFCYGNGEVHYLIKRSYKRFKEDQGTARINQNHNPFSGSTAGGIVTCRSVLLGRSTGSLTNYSMADGSPNPHQRPVAMTCLTDNNTAAYKTSLSESRSNNPEEVAVRKTSRKARRTTQDSPTGMNEDLLVCETCVE